MRQLCFLAGFIVAASVVDAAAPCDAPRNGSPLVPGCLADPTIRKCDDTYYSQPCQVYGGVSPTPLGPWTSLMPGGEPVVRDHLIKEVITLDGQTFRDDDGAWYMYWGTWGVFEDSGCGVGRLNTDMKSFSKLSLVPNTDVKEFFEGPFLLKRRGVYYLMYSSGSCHTDSYCVQYAMGPSPTGPFRMGPNNPILSTNADKTVHGPGHHSVLQLGEDYYIVYHRHDDPYTPNGMHRQIAADRLVFDRITVTGVEGPGLNGAIWNFQAFADATEDPPQLLVHLEADDLVGDRTARWTNNKGMLGGGFESVRLLAVKEADGRRAVVFGPSESMATISVPGTLRPGRACTVAAWVWPAEGSGADAPMLACGKGADGGAVVSLRAVEAAGRGGWHHLAETGDADRRFVYVDGKLNNQSTKMLLLHEDDPIFIGAADGTTEFLDGYIASLRVYDEALPAAQVARLAGESSTSDLLVHRDSGRFDYGPAERWVNRAALGGQFVAAGPAPIVADVAGRIALRFDGTAKWQSRTSVGAGLKEQGARSVVLAVQCDERRAIGEIITWAGGAGLGGLDAQAAVEGGAAWHLVAVTRDGRQRVAYVDGRRVCVSAAVKGQAAAGPIVLGGFRGAVASLQIRRTALSAKVVGELWTAWQGGCKPPSSAPAAFAETPRAMSTVAVVMRAAAARAEKGSVQYRFEETTGHGGGASGWVDEPVYIDHGLKPNTAYAYTVKVRDTFGNVTRPSEPVRVTIDAAQFDEHYDAFGSNRDCLADGAGGTIWQGMFSDDPNKTPPRIAAEGGLLHMSSRGAYWDGRSPRGLLLYRLAKGDFVAETRIADYEGLSKKQSPANNDGGLMVRVPRVEDAGEGEDLLQLSFFPICNVGNMWTSLDPPGRPQVFNRLAWNAHRYLQVERRGNAFHMRTSADGKSWVEMPGSPVVRKDMDGLAVQVGCFHCMYSASAGSVAYDYFRLSEPRAPVRPAGRPKNGPK